MALSLSLRLGSLVCQLNMELWQGLGLQYLNSVVEILWSRSDPLSLEPSFDNPFLAVFEAFPRDPCLQSLDLTILLQSLLGWSHLLYLHRRYKRYYQCARMHSLWHTCSSLRACVPNFRLPWGSLRLALIMMVHVVKGPQYYSAYTVGTWIAEMESETDSRPPSFDASVTEMSSIAQYSSQTSDRSVVAHCSMRATYI